MKRKIWNVDFSEITDLKLLNELDQQFREGCSCKSIAFVNPHSQVVARHDAKLLAGLNQFDYILCDGVGTEWAAKLFKEYDIKRLSGPDFFRLLSKHLNHQENTVSYYFLGSTNKVLQKICSRMKDEYPYIPVVGTYSPPMGEFSSEDNKIMIKKINNSNCTVLWVGLTAPKQEKWIATHLSKLNTCIAAGIGAEFDYFAATKPRPPQWISKSGLQWVHRLITQPSTWRRTVISSPIFIVNVLVFWLKSNVKNKP